MTDREKLERLIDEVAEGIVFVSAGEQCVSINTGDIADHLIANGVVVQGYGYKAESGISKTGFMCTACHSDVDRDAVYCKYCGAKMVPEPPKEE